MKCIAIFEKNTEIDPAQLAIQFCNIQLMTTSTIIGATTMEQLKTCIDSVDLDITKEIMNEQEVFIKKFKSRAIMKKIPKAELTIKKLKRLSGWKMI